MVTKTEIMQLSRNTEYILGELKKRLEKNAGRYTLCNVDIPEFSKLIDSVDEAYGISLWKTLPPEYKVTDEKVLNRYNLLKKMFDGFFSDKPNLEGLIAVKSLKGKPKILN